MMFTAAQFDVLADASLRERAFAGEIGADDVPRLDDATLRELEKTAHQRAMHQWTSLGMSRDELDWSRKWGVIHMWIVGEMNRRGERAAWQGRAA